MRKEMQDHERAKSSIRSEKTTSSTTISHQTASQVSQIEVFVKIRLVTKLAHQLCGHVSFTPSLVMVDPHPLPGAAYTPGTQSLPFRPHMGLISKDIVKLACQYLAHKLFLPRYCAGAPKELYNAVIEIPELKVQPYTLQSLKVAFGMIIAGHTAVLRLHNLP